MRKLLLLVAVLALGACSGSSAEPTDAGGDGGAPIDACNSAADALNTPECQLSLGDGGVQGWVFPSGDHDWWHLHIDTVPPRALLTVTADMAVPQSVVTLQVLVFQGTDASANIGSQSDPKPRGAPSPTTVVSRISQPGDYFVLVQDDTSDNDDPAHGDADARHPYSLKATLASDVDLNEPNDTLAQATVVPLSGNQAQVQGALATQGDVDVYAVDIPAANAAPNRWVLYVGLDAPDLTPDSQIRLGYSVNLDDGAGADGGVIAAGHALTASGEEQASNALLVRQPGRYYVTVQPYLASPATDPVPPGDPRLQYTLDVRLVQDLDTNEPNDTPSQATPVSIGSPAGSGAGPQRTVSGRIGFVPDPDWINVTLLGSQGQNTRLRYALTLDEGAANSKRFPPAGAVYPLGDVGDHQITVSVPFADTSTCEAACPNEASSVLQPIVQGGCARPSHECIYSYRLEGPYPDGGGGMLNFQGEIPVPAHSGDVSYHILVEDQGNNGADDRVYNLQLWWLDEPTADDQTGPVTESLRAGAPQSLSPTLGSYAADPGSSNAARGSFSFGHGVQAENQADNSLGLIPIKQEVDYDAINDTDYYKITLPSVTGTALPDGGTQVPALAWSSAWTLPPPSGASAGSRAYDLQMTYYFCDGDKYGPNGCDPQTGKWEAIGVGYASGTIAGWTNAGTPGWSVDANSGRFVTNASECFCIEPRFVKGGVMYMSVSGVSRASYEDAPYEVDTAFANYPQSFIDGTGAQKTCPDFLPDGGGRTCHFCNQQFGDGCQTVDGIQLPRVLP